MSQRKPTRSHNLTKKKSKTEKNVNNKIFVREAACERSSVNKVESKWWRRRLHVSPDVALFGVTSQK